MTEPLQPVEPRTETYGSEHHLGEHHDTGRPTHDAPAYGAAPPFGAGLDDGRTHGRDRGHDTSVTGANDGLRVSSGGRSATITPEAIVYALAVAAVFITAAIIDEEGPGPGFSASRAWFYVTLLTVAYIVSRGLSRIGSRGDDRSPRI